jgi:hypothetical protein
MELLGTFRGPLRIRDDVSAGSFSPMRRFYFDFHGDDGIIIDDDGEESSSVEDARKEALIAPVGAGRDFARRYSDGRLAALVREGPMSLASFAAVTASRDNWNENAAPSF